MQFVEHFVNWIFDDNNNNNRLNLKDECLSCLKKCHKRCECRCHVRSCRKCDRINCEFKSCKCNCHIVNVEVSPSKVNNSNNISKPSTNNKPTKVKEMFMSSKPMKVIGNKVTATEPKSNPNQKESPNKSFMKNYLNKIRTVKEQNKVVEEKSTQKSISKENIAVEADQIQKENYIAVPAESPSRPSLKDIPLKSVQPLLIKFRKKKKNNQNIKNNQEEKHNNSNNFIENLETNMKNKITINKKKVNVDDPLFYNHIKRRIENMKFKDLDSFNKSQNNSMNNSALELGNSFDINNTRLLELTNLNNSSFIDTKLDQKNNLVMNKIPLSPVPHSSLNVNKSHLNNSFDINNSKLYHEKSKIVLAMEDVKKVLNHKNLKDKDYQIKNVIKGLESQDAWQTYNSLIFANPVDLPESKDLRKELDKNYFSIEKAEKKTTLPRKQVTIAEQINSTTKKR